MVGFFFCLVDISTLSIVVSLAAPKNPSNNPETTALAWDQ